MRIRRLPAGGARRCASPATDAGATLVDVTLTLALVLSLMAITAPLTARVRDDGRVRQAAGFAAAKLRFARQDAVARGKSTGAVFDVIGGRWVFRLCIDGNQNGLRRAELGGPDRCIEGPFDIEALFGVAVAVDPALPGPSGEPGSPDPVRFGASDLASFSPVGTSSSGSLLLRSPQGTHLMVRLAGVTGRTRILRYDSHLRSWRDT